MYRVNRAIILASSVLSDISTILSYTKFGAPSYQVDMAPGDFLFIGSEMPFNHRFFFLGSPNTDDATAQVDIWDGSSSWNPAVDVQDYTFLGTDTSMSQSGLLLFTPDRTKFWGREDKTADIPQLNTLSIFNQYWARISFTGTVSFDLRYLGFRFASDDDLGIYYMDLDDAEVRAAFFKSTDETNWDRIHVAAAEEVIAELKKRDIVWSANQVLDPDIFRAAATHKMAHIVYSAFGSSHESRRDEAYKQFQRAMNMLKFNVDRNGDGRLEEYEKVTFSTLRRV